MALQLPANLNSDEFARLLSKFDVDAGSAKLLGASQNFVYQVVRRGQEIIARVSTQRHRARDEIDGELVWVLQLAKGGVTACAPVRSNRGALCEDEIVNEQAFLLSVFEKAPGKKPEPTDLSEDLCFRVGRLIGQIHTTSQPRFGGVELQRSRWSSSRLLTDDVAACPLVLTGAFRDRLRDLIRGISGRPEAVDTFGLFHGDVNFGNLHIDGDRLWIFDFDNCEYGFFLQDLATMLYDSIYSKVVNHLAPEALTASIKRLWKALLMGYRTAGPDLRFSSDELFDCFLLREAVIYVHYHRVQPRDKWADPFLHRMARNVEMCEHALDFEQLVC